MKTVKYKIDNYKDTSLSELAYELKWNTFKEENTDLDEDELSDKFYNEVVSKLFEYGEYTAFELEIDENLNIVGGRLIPTGTKQ
jgi:hypothetical protein